MRAIVLGCAMSLAACTQFPDLDASVSDAARNASYPDLVPVEGLLAQMPEAQVTPEMQSGLEARIAALRARAARLRGTVVDSSTRARMRRGITPIENG